MDYKVHLGGECDPIIVSGAETFEVDGQGTLIMEGQ